jgi:WW domain/Ankyrin repeats (many copies)
MAAFDPHAAARAGDIEGLRAFLKSGRCADETDEWGNTPLHVSASLGDEVNLVCSSLIFPAPVAYIVLQAAAMAGRADVAQALVNAGAAVTVRNKHGDMPIDWAIRNGHSELVSALIASFTPDVTPDVSPMPARAVNLLDFSDHTHTRKLPEPPTRQRSQSRKNSADSSVDSIKKKGLFSSSKRSGSKQKTWHTMNDDATGQTYYMNVKTGESQWTVPEEHIKASAATAASTVKGASNSSSKRKGSWMLYQDEQGHSYYYNEKTGESR